MKDFVPPIGLRDNDHQYWSNAKMDEELLAPVLAAFFTELGMPILLRKRHYHRLVRYLGQPEVHQDIVYVLDAIVSQTDHAFRPATAR